MSDDSHQGWPLHYYATWVEMNKPHNAGGQLLLIHGLPKAILGGFHHKEHPWGAGYAEG